MRVDEGCIGDSERIPLFEVPGTIYLERERERKKERERERERDSLKVPGLRSGSRHHTVYLFKATPRGGAGPRCGPDSDSEGVLKNKP